MLPAGIVRPYVAVESLVAYGQRSSRGRARDVDAVSRVACIAEGVASDVGERWVSPRDGNGPFETLKGTDADVFQQ